MNPLCRYSLLILCAVLGPGCDSGATPKPVVFDPSIPVREIPPGHYTRVTDIRQQVTLTRSFWIGIHEVTQQQYASLMGSNPSFHRGESLPVEKISFQQAVAFCSTLTRRDREAGRIPVDMIYRLPTEAEWEYACLAGATTPFSFGDTEEEADTHAWTAENADDKTNPVGKKQPNAWGLHDMHGNVWEWVADWFAPHPKDAVLSDPIGSPTGKHRVFKGGGWYHEAKFVRSTTRFMMEPAMSINFVGFRLVLANVKTAN